MNNNRTSSARDSRDWKDKYLAELESQEKRERQHQQMMELLIRAVVRISLVADGVDQRLDKQLAGLRHMLREGTPSGRDINTMVSALEGQVKHLDIVKSERAKALVSAFQSLANQLKDLNAGKDAKQKIKQFSKNLKTRSARIHEYSALINEYASLQQSVLQGCGQQESKKPFWQNLFAQRADAGENRTDPGQADTTDVQPSDMSGPDHSQADEDKSNEHNDNKAEQCEGSEQRWQTKTPAHSDHAKNNVAGSDLAASLDLAEEGLRTQETVSQQVDQKEPPFIRLSNAICGILSELLAQIEPPAMAKENYNKAQEQVAKGLNWYELVPTLEDISIVVISAFDSYQKEFEQFLLQLNQRLGEASQFIDASEQAQDSRVAAGKQLSNSVREHVSSMQQSVENAADLDQLKSEVSLKLDTILLAVDQFQHTDQQREEALSDQLNALIERVKLMEQDSANAEQRIEEQRQRALRDVLTQLPNREAYQIQLEQEFQRWQRYQRPLSLMVCDIDHFKQVNDNYGHLAGDKVLRIIGKSLAKRLRKADFIARYGGEEFVVLMPETQQAQALKVAEGIRSAIAVCPFHFKEKPVSITLSFGITEFIDQDKPDSAFVRADKALYDAKEQGRNCCVVAGLPAPE